MSDNSTTPSQFTEWFKAGWAFLLAIFGWVWHMSRAAAKLDNVEKTLSTHLEQSTQAFKENQQVHQNLLDAITKLKEDLAYMKGDHSHKKSYRVGEDE
jgi:hypothetical protein